LLAAVVSVNYNFCSKSPSWPSGRIAPRPRKRDRRPSYRRCRGTSGRKLDGAVPWWPTSGAGDVADGQGEQDRSGVDAASTTPLRSSLAAQESQPPPLFRQHVGHGSVGGGQPPACEVGVRCGLRGVHRRGRVQELRVELSQGERVDMFRGGHASAAASRTGTLLPLLALREDMRPGFHVRSVAGGLSHMYRRVAGGRVAGTQPSRCARRQWLRAADVGNPEKRASARPGCLARHGFEPHRGHAHSPALTRDDVRQLDRFCLVPSGWNPPTADGRAVRDRVPARRAGTAWVMRHRARPRTHR
jgi:hypothetical protein